MEESNRQEVKILDYSDNMRKLQASVHTWCQLFPELVIYRVELLCLGFFLSFQTEKQMLSLKVSHFEREIKEIYEHTRAVVDSVPKINSHHDRLAA